MGTREAREKPGPVPEAPDTVTETYDGMKGLALSVLENDAIGIAVLDPGGRYRVFNAGAEKITGYTLEDLLGKTAPQGLYPNDEREEIDGALSRSAVIKNLEMRIRRKDGTEKEITFSMTPRVDGKGVVTGYLQFLLDNTEKKHLQELLQHSQKMETVGEMAGGIAHDFNNLLEGILGYTTFMMDLVAQDHEFRVYLEIIERAARKASALTDRLLTLSRDSSPEQKPVNCNVLLREVVKLLERTIDKRIIIEMNLEKKLKAIMGAAGQLEQGFLNVCLNARDAMPEGGKLTISSENVFLDETFPKLSWNMRTGNYVKISISDTGTGMDQETRARIFEPFFTTKKRGDGTGLGLNMVYGIMDSHGGLINVYSEVGSGTVFNIYLPAGAESLPDVEAREERREVPPGNGELILLIDDEELIRELGVEILTKLGYRPVTAGDADEGLKRYYELKDELSMVILDMVMPGGSGKDVLGKIREQSSDVFVLLSSGYNRISLGEDLIKGGRVDFIQKPYSMEDLAWEIHKLLSGAGDEGEGGDP